MRPWSNTTLHELKIILRTTNNLLLSISIFKFLWLLHVPHERVINHVLHLAVQAIAVTPYASVFDCIKDKIIQIPYLFNLTKRNSTFSKRKPNTQLKLGTPSMIKQFLCLLKSVETVIVRSDGC